MINYIPILTTAFALIFFVRVFSHARQKPQAIYLLWWSIGIATYGLGTLTESVHALIGWTEWNMKSWYILGALMGGAPLAQGTVYLLMRKKVADTLTVILILVILIAAISVLMTPVQLPASFDGRLSGKVFTWQWVRRFSPFINSYAFIFLFGGAVFSALKYRKLGKRHSRFLGNVFIAIGALLPGIGGSFTRFGYVEVLYVTELLGIAFIYLGYIIMRNDNEISIHLTQKVN